MIDMRRRTLLGILGAAPLAGGLLKQVSAQVIESGSQFKANSSSRELSSRELVAQRNFPNVPLTTHEGKQVRFYDDLVKNKIVIFNFMYAQCEGICPGIMMNLVRVKKLLGPRVGKDIFMYSITLKPEQDTPMALKHYADMHRAGPGWTFLTGQPDDIERLRRAQGFTNPDPLLDADKSQHIGMIRFGNEPMQWWAGCPGMANPKFIVKEIGLVLGNTAWPTDKPPVTKGGRK
jgi:protein SCO1/2